MWWHLLLLLIVLKNKDSILLADHEIPDNPSYISVPDLVAAGKHNVQDWSNIPFPSSSQSFVHIAYVTAYYSSSNAYSFDVDISSPPSRVCRYSSGSCRVNSCLFSVIEISGTVALSYCWLCGCRKVPLTFIHNGEAVSYVYSPVVVARDMQKSHPALLLVPLRLRPAQHKSQGSQFNEANMLKGWDGISTCPFGRYCSGTLSIPLLQEQI